jgi:hypothetical protein
VRPDHYFSDLFIGQRVFGLRGESSKKGEPRRSVERQYYTDPFREQPATTLLAMGSLGDDRCVAPGSPRLTRED